ncbi:hypothetical protein BSLA_02r4297 [Burkholderia stabilis]|nr:hypothetical protein BSLA_02r4297 [Burkholderia stabilis]
MVNDAVPISLSRAVITLCAARNKLPPTLRFAVVVGPEECRPPCPD